MGKVIGMQSVLVVAYGLGTEVGVGQLIRSNS